VDPRTLLVEANVDTLWRGLADAVAGVHYGYIGYMIAGGFLAWRWPKTIWVHVVAVVWAVLIVTTKVPCPLTALQNHLRESAGERPLSGSFINTYIRGTFYPADQQTLARVATGLVIVVSWLGFARLRRHAQRAELTREHALQDS
jgi:hypothetical protein